LNPDLKYYIALSKLKNMGSITAKKLISYSGGAKEVFQLRTRKSLEKVPGIGSALCESFLSQLKNAEDILAKADEEVAYIQENNITALIYHEPEYPNRLRYCNDSPLILFKKGEVDFNQEKVISVVGTRNATDYGKSFMDSFFEEIAAFKPLVVSGLAYGVDIYAHKLCLQHNIPTVAVLGHGFNLLYPGVHKKTAEEMCANGGLLTEFYSDSNFDRENFPKRNRIVAGMADVTVVVETAMKGGSMITADLANSYSRDVMALPGDYRSKYSVGCNHLIKNHKAAVIESAYDLIKLMNWDVQKTSSKPIQRELFIDLEGNEALIFNLLQEQIKLPIDSICNKSNLPVSTVSSCLLNLEFRGFVKSLPGKVYQLT
jgi:DNA processing protein